MIGRTASDSIYDEDHNEADDDRHRDGYLEVMRVPRLDDVPSFRTDASVDHVIYSGLTLKKSHQLPGLQVPE